MISLKRWIRKLKNHLIIKLGGSVMPPISEPKLIMSQGKIDVLNIKQLIPNDIIQGWPDSESKKMALHHMYLQMENVLLNYMTIDIRESNISGCTELTVTLKVVAKDD